MTAVRARLLALDAAPVAVFAALTALASQVSVHAWPVPFTLQTLTVLSSGLLLGARRGAAAQATFLLAGLCGLPVFAEGKFGPFWAFPTGGYLVGFVLAAWLAGLAGERLKGWSRGLGVAGAALALLALGALWLSLTMPKDAFTSGFLLVLPNTLVQAAVALGLSRAIRRDAA